MKNLFIYIVFLFIIAIYISLNFYIANRISKIHPEYKKLIYIVVISLSLFYITGRIIEYFYVCTFSNLLIWAGAIWMGLFVYLLIGFLFVDIIKIPLSYLSLNDNFVKSINNLYFIIIMISIILITFGFFNAKNPVLKEIYLSSNKKSIFKNLKIAYASDIHLGSIVSNSRLEKLVKIINDNNPDIIIFGGDILDEDIKPVIKNNLGELLLKLKSKYGIFAVPGNHEYIGNINKALEYIKNHNIKILRDLKINIKDITIIGRDDRASYSFIGKKRKSLNELLQNVNTNSFIIVVDHQPFSLEKTTTKPVDLLLCGHTHHGQMFPFNLITSKLYKISWGYKKINNTNVYVSSGYGTWGPPIRIGNKPEIVIFNITFNK